jgi:hypothetical protein
VNDRHGNDFLRTQFLVDHPEWRLGTEQYQGKGAMDFGRDEVRDHTCRLLEEAVNRYDCDGIELDFNRFPTFVTVSEFLFERGDLPIGQWKEAITTVPVYGGIECTKGGGQKNLTADEYRLAAVALKKAGADGTYLFNFFTSREEGEQAYEPPFEVLRDLEPAGAQPGGIAPVHSPCR